jgi:hypothetical protein
VGEWGSGGGVGGRGERYTIQALAFLPFSCTTCRSGIDQTGGLFIVCCRLMETLDTAHTHVGNAKDIHTPQFGGACVLSFSMKRKGIWHTLYFVSYVHYLARQIDREADRWVDKQADRQTDGETYSHVDK